MAHKLSVDDSRHNFKEYLVRGSDGEFVKHNKDDEGNAPSEAAMMNFPSALKLA
jgi:hypothetical protein